MTSLLAFCLLTAPPAGANLALIGLPGGGVVTAGYVLTANQGSDCRIQRHSSLGGSGWTLDDGGVGSDACLAIAAWDKDRVVAAGVTYGEGAGGQAYIIGVDAQGRRAFRIAHGSTAHEELRGVAITALGIVGVGLKREANTPARGYLVIADPERGVLGEEVHGAAGEHRFDAVTSLPDGQIVVVGTSASPDALPAAWVVRIARTGDLIWDRRIGGDAWHEARDVVALPDGRIVVAGMAFPGGFVAILAGNGDPISVVRSPLGAPFEAAVTIGDGFCCEPLPPGRQPRGGCKHKAHRGAFAPRGRV